MMVRCTDRLSLFAAPATLDDDYDIAADAFEEVTQQDPRDRALTWCSTCRTCGRGWMRQILLAADDVVIVADARPRLAAQRQEHRRPVSARRGPTTRRRGWC